MREEDVKFYMKNFFDKHGYKVKVETYVHGYRVDLLAEKKGEKFFVECKGDKHLRSHEIHVMIGQLVSEMHEVGPSIHYGLAIPFLLSTYLRDFGAEGIKALKLHLFIVGQGDIWNGEIFFLDNESTINYIQALKKDSENAWLSLFTLKKQLV